MKTFGLIPFLIMWSAMSCYAETPNLAVILKGGASFYGSVYVGSFGGGSGGESVWKTGPILGGGIQIQATKSIAFEAVAEYSTHRYAPPEGGYPATNDPANSIIDISGNVKISWGSLYFIGGVALSHQDKDDVQLTLPSGGIAVEPGRHETIFCGSLGLGINFRRQISLACFLREASECVAMSPRCYKQASAFNSNIHPPHCCVVLSTS